MIKTSLCVLFPLSILLPEMRALNEYESVINACLITILLL